MREKFFQNIFHSLLLKLFILSILTTTVRSARILGIFPFPGPSQYIAVEPYLKALAARGHELTVISHFPQKQKLANFRDVTIEYEGYEKVIQAALIGDTEKQKDFYAQFFHNVTLTVLENAAVQELLFSGVEHFDLVITEMLLTEALYAIATHFSAHLMGISTYGTDLAIDQWTGNPSPLSYVPLVTTDLTDHMNFWQRLNNFIRATISWYYINYMHLPVQRAIYKQFFPKLQFELEDIAKNFSLILLNQHFTLSFPRPYVPNLIEVGGMYLEHKPKPLPADIQEFIDGAEHGVIYFSMGSNVKSAYFDMEKREAVLKVLGSLKERVLWKFEDTELPGKPSNVLIKNWFPQHDILAHPNVKLFITHAGILSTIEAIYHGKPIVGIPVCLDQFYNVARARHMGYGVVVKYLQLNEYNFRAAIVEVLTNDSYAKAVQKISKRYHDQAIKPLDLAIYWTEYVLRHHGAYFMQVTARELSFWQYFCLDVISFIVAVVLLSLCILTIVLWGTFGIVRKAFKSGRKDKLS